jgi:hypothetical protein
MKLVLKAVFAESTVRPVSDGMETPRRRAITISPKAGGSILLTPTDRTVDQEKLAQTAA